MTTLLFLSIWAALILFVAGEAGKRSTGAAFRRARLAWTMGAALCALHMAIAFVVVHGASREAMVAATARQTAAVYGLDWGGGAYVNVLFLIAWIAEAAWWQASPGTYRQRPAWTVWALRAFYFVVILNGAVIFASGPGRLAGVLLVAAWMRLVLKRPEGP